MIKIKICGLRLDSDIDYVNDARPDYAGFILSKGFRRSVDYDDFLSLRKRLDGDIKTVGVFVNDDVEKINNIVDKGLIDLVQLHGDETPEYCARINAPVIKAVQFGKGDFNCDDYNTEYVLLDSGQGTGKTFDWSKISSMNKPFFLAGGISIDNIDEAVKLKPYCIDVSSGAETKGIKDKGKILDLVRRIRQYE